MLNRLFTYFLLVNLLVACVPTPTTSSTATFTAPISHATIRPTSTSAPFLSSATVFPIASAIPPTVTASSTNNPTRRPTSTPLPLVTPQPSATPLFPAVYILPDWADDPQAAVLLTALSPIPHHNENIVSLLNASTGERFDLLRSPEYWHTTSQYTETGLAFILYLSLPSGHNPDDFFLHQIDLATGQVSQAPLSTLYDEGLAAPNDRFVATITGEPEMQNVTIVDRQNGELVTLNDPFNGRYPDHATIDWSADGELLAVMRYKWDFVNFGPPATGLAIYTADGRLYRYYANVNSWTWAPDGSYRLITIVGSFFDNGEPCILDVQVNTVDCLGEVAAWRENGIAKTGDYQWLPDGSSLSFLYWDHATRKAGLCVIDLTSRAITCPVDEMLMAPANLGAEVGAMTYLVSYQWSPDGRYLLLEIDTNGPESDDRALTQLATVTRDGDQFYLWGFGSLWVSTWRP